MLRLFLRLVLPFLVSIFVATELLGFGANLLSDNSDASVISGAVVLTGTLFGWTMFMVWVLRRYLSGIGQ